MHSSLRSEVASNKKALAQERLRLLSLEKKESEVLKEEEHKKQELMRKGTTDLADLNPGERVLAYMQKVGKTMPED